MNSIRFLAPLDYPSKKTSLPQSVPSELDFIPDRKLGFMAGSDHIEPSAERKVFGKQ